MLSLSTWEYGQQSRARSLFSLQGIPSSTLLVFSFIIQATTKMKRKGDSIHPCLTPVLMSKASDSSFSVLTLYPASLYMSHDVAYFNWYTIVAKYLPN